ncbi:unnamed protein product [Rotaria sp. Silwood2]|nr:unnamed protein product [Rotaria sp. Silwood2]
MNTEANQPKQCSFIEQSYRSIFVSYLTSSTTHGLRCIAEAYSTPNRILWICSFVFAFGWMLFFVISSGLQYMSYPTQIDMEIRTEYNMIFPAVTVCSANPLRKDKTNAALLAYAKRMGINTTTVDLETLVEPLIVDLFNRNQKNELIDLGFQLSDILISCSYNGIDCSSYFTHSLSSQFGNCYTFNWNGKMKNLFTIRNMSTLNIGLEGLSMQFYIPRESYYPVSYFDEGLLVSIHENNEFPLIVNDGLRLQTGLSHTILFSKTERNLLPEPYTNCTSSVGDELRDIYETAFDKDSIGKVTYSESLCQESCLKLITDVFCSCVLPFPFFQRNVWTVDSNSLKTANTCIPDTSEEQCALTTVPTFKVQNAGYKKWCPQCTPECKNTDFHAVLSALSYPSPKQKAVLTKRLLDKQPNSSNVLLPDDFALKSDMYLSNNLLKVTIASSNYYVIVYNQKAKMLIVDLFSSIGGQTGIWVGLSILGVIEFGEVLFKMIVKYLVFVKRKAKKPIKENYQQTYLNRLSTHKYPWEKFLEEGIQYLLSHNIECLPPNNDRLYIKMENREIAEVKHPDQRKKGYYRPTICFGMIADGKNILTNDYLKTTLCDRCNVLCFDSEIDQVIAAIQGNRTESFMIIRGVSDYHDGTSNKEWQPFSSLYDMDSYGDDSRRRPSIILDAGYVSISSINIYQSSKTLDLHGNKLMCYFYNH